MKIWKAWLGVVAVGFVAWFIAESRGQQESLPVGPPPADAPPTDARHYSYAIGLDVGSSFGKDQIELDVDSLLAGVRDGLAGAKPKFDKDLCRASLERLAVVRSQSLKKKNQEYLAANAKAPGVQTTPSGLQYKVISSGSGATPGPQDTVKVHYRGQLIDGSVFDESIGGDPVMLPVNRVIPGWTEALQKMKVGDKWQLTIPAELAYREVGAGDVIPPNSTLIFDLELLGIEPAK